MREIRLFSVARVLAGTCFATIAFCSVVQASTLTYEQGEDRAKFIEQLRQARKGDMESQWTVATTYVRLGEYERAVSLLSSAAAGGHVRATGLLASLTEDGHGVEKRIDQAIVLYRIAAEKGDIGSMDALVRLLPKSDPLVHGFRQRSAESGSPDGQFALGQELSEKGGDKLAEAHEWFLKAARQGHIGAQVALAKQFLDGKGAKADVKAAKTWLQQASDRGDPVASYLLAQSILADNPKKTPPALELLRIAAKAGHREAQYLLGKLLEEEKTVESRAEANLWFEKAHTSGHVAATNSLGKLLLGAQSDTTKLQQLVRARELFFAAAQKGDFDAMYNFAEMQHAGLGGEKDTFEALKWYGRAADGKHERAREVVDNLLGSSIKTSSLGIKGFWQK